MDLSFRPLVRADFSRFQKWLSEPHVDQWWHQSLDLTGIEAKYGPRIDGIEPTHLYVILFVEKPVGWIQWYRWSDYPDHARQLYAEPNTAGLDLALGEKELLGQGLGPRVIRQFMSEIIFIHDDIAGIVSDPEENNVRSLRAFEKSGFDVTRRIQLKGENVWRRVVALMLVK